MTESKPPPTGWLPAALSGVALVGGLAAVVLMLTGVQTWAGLTTVAALSTLALSATASPQFRSLAFTAWVLAFGASAWFYPWLYTWSWHGWEPKGAILPLV